MRVHPGLGLLGNIDNLKNRIYAAANA
jgi:hypothetical protein